MTARTDLELEAFKILPANNNQDFDDEDDEELYRFYDQDENYYELRHKRGDMPGTDHNDVVDYLLQVLLWFYRQEQFAVYRELNVYQTARRDEKPLYPDIFILKTQKRQKPRSYHLNVDGSAPDALIEIISEATRRRDLKQKPLWYARWGVSEYFVYDPRERKRKSKQPRLWGWQMVDGQPIEMQPASDGRIWSEQLDSWLVPDGDFLRLYDRDNNLRLIKAEYEQCEKEAAQQQVEAERRGRKLALLQKELAEAKVTRLAEKLRQLGYDPDEL